MWHQSQCGDNITIDVNGGFEQWNMSQQFTKTIQAYIDRDANGFGVGKNRLNILTKPVGMTLN